MTDAAEKEPRKRAIESVKAIFERWHGIAASTGYRGFDWNVMNDVELIDASIGPPESVVGGCPATPSSPGILSSSVSKLHISEAYGNINGVMHGGAAGVIFDMLTTIALAPVSRKGYWDFLGGVTRVLNLTYLKAVPIDTTVHVHAYVYQVGRTMAFIRGWMTSKDGQTVYTTCEHHKVHLPSKKEHMDHRIEWDTQWEDEKKGSKL